MKSIIVQFYASQNEIYKFANDVIEEFGIYISVMSGRNPRTSTYREKIPEDEQQYGGGISLLITKSPPVVGADTPRKFLADNDGAIVLRIGEQSEEVLRESTLSFSSDNAAAYEVAKNIAKALKKMTTAGVTVVNPSSKEEVFSKSLRYSNGARTLFERGVIIQPLAGTNIVRL